MKVAVCGLVAVFASQAQSVCKYPVDVMFIQGTRAKSNLANVREQMPDVIEKFNQVFPKSRAGIAEFRDKPYLPLGARTDYCYKRPEDGALAMGSDHIVAALSKMRAVNGGDEKDDHYQAGINAWLDSGITWRPIVGSNDAFSASIRESIANRSVSLASGDEVAGRVLVYITNSHPHFVGDMKKAGAPELPANDGSLVNGDLNSACVNRGYLNPPDFKALIKDEANFQVVTLNAIRDDVWTWVSDTLLDQPSEFRQTVDADYKDIVNPIAKAVAALKEAICKDLPEPTNAPTTVATTSVATTTIMATTIPATTIEPTTIPATTIEPTTILASTIEPTPASTIEPTPASTIEPTTANELTTDTGDCSPDCECENDCECEDDCEEDGPCCDDSAVVLKLKEKPLHMILEVFNEDFSTDMSAEAI